MKSKACPVEEGTRYRFYFRYVILETGCVPRKPSGEVVLESISLSIPVSESNKSSVPVSDKANSSIPVSENPSSSIPVSENPNSSIPVSESANSSIPVAENANSSIPVEAVNSRVQYEEDRTIGNNSDTVGPLLSRLRADQKAEKLLRDNSPDRISDTNSPSNNFSINLQTWRSSEIRSPLSFAVDKHNNKLTINSRTPSSFTENTGNSLQNTQNHTENSHNPIKNSKNSTENILKPTENSLNLTESSQNSTEKPQSSTQEIMTQVNEEEELYAEGLIEDSLLKVKIYYVFYSSSFVFIKLFLLFSNF